MISQFTVVALCQAFELCEFVRHTSSDADVVLVMGDLNLEPDDNGFQLIIDNAQLRDAWSEAKKTGDGWANFGRIPMRQILQTWMRIARLTA